MKAGVETLTVTGRSWAHAASRSVVAPGAIATDFAGGAVRDNPPTVGHRTATALGRVGRSR